MTASPSILVVGTRGSRLALIQTELIVNLLQDRFPGLQCKVAVVETEGDRVRDRPISQFGDKGVFVRAIERALLEGTIDLAVHSLKDVPSDVEMPDLELAAFSPRADPRDVLVSRRGEILARLPAGARIGTSSPRRRLELRTVRPDLLVVDIRGNVDTRVKKVQDGEYAAVILAAAGLTRLGRDDAIAEYLSPQVFIPDAGQGIIAVQARRGSEGARLAARIDNCESRTAAIAERAVVRALGAGCSSPVGAHAVPVGNRLRVSAIAAATDAGPIDRAEDEGPIEDAELIGTRLGNHLSRRLRRETYTWS